MTKKLAIVLLAAVGFVIAAPNVMPVGMKAEFNNWMNAIIQAGLRKPPRGLPPTCVRLSLIR
jgi:hypothetical protein